MVKINTKSVHFSWLTKTETKLSFFKLKLTTLAQPSIHLNYMHVHPGLKKTLPVEAWVYIHVHSKLAYV